MVELGDKWKAWGKRFWWLRGALAAMAVAAAVPNVTDLSRFELLRAFHALVVSWNDVMAAIGGWIGKLPFVPRISAEIINSVVFGFTISAPAALHFSSHKIKDFDLCSFRNQLKVLRGIVPHAMAPFVYAAAYYLVIKLSDIALNWINNPERASTIPLFFVISLILVAIGCFASSLIISLSVNKRFRVGFFCFLGFVLTIEIMYILSIGGGFINDWACRTLNIPPENC